MPFRSEAQRRYLWAKHPKLAREWSDKYGVPSNLPAHAPRLKYGHPEIRQAMEDKRRREQGR